MTRRFQFILLVQHLRLVWTAVMIRSFLQGFANFAVIMAPRNFITSFIFPENYDSVKTYSSSLGFKYPTWRDFPLHSTEMWLKGKRADDGAESLWRIYDKLYDFTDFVKLHPGGSFWLEKTKGTDITEAFEVHHISSAPQSMLPKFFVREAASPRNSPFTFKEDGFYKVLKNNVREALKDIPEWPARRSRLIADLLVLGYLSVALLAAYFRSFALGAIAGLFLSCTVIASHNFFHQRNNFRMYYFNLSLMSFKSWRISHALSHHVYTNTVNDLEITSLEPFFQYLPRKKPIFFQHLSWLISPIVYVNIFFGQSLIELIQNIWSCSNFSVAQLLPFAVPASMYLVTGQSPLWITIIFLWILVCGSFCFGLVGVNAAHHHPDIFHDGDTPRPKDEMDWGVYQLDAVMDREDITGSHFLVLTNFGDHALHHLFPTVDHGKLEYLYPVLDRICKDFGVELTMKSQLEMVRGQYLQLVNATPRLQPPKPLKKRLGSRSHQF